MAGEFSVRALGKGSIASIVKLGLEAIWFVLWVIAFAVAAAALFYLALLGLVGAGAVDANVLTGGEGSIRLGPASGSFSVDYDTTEGITWPVAVPGLLAASVWAAGGLVIVWRLRRLFASFTSGEPFRKENADHLRVIWIAMLVLELARYGLMALTHALVAIFHPPEAESASFEISINVSTWAAILILIVLAEVFREGARLREDQELTV